MSESITSVCGGCVSSSGYDEIVAATYAGWVVGLTTEPQQKEAGPMTASQEPISDEVQAKIDNLRLGIICTGFCVFHGLRCPTVATICRYNDRGNGTITITGKMM